MSSKRYGQWCGLAQALDRVGDRWTLLVIRELLIGARRYSDLRANLPGIASNLLVDRLRDMEHDGLVCRRELPPPSPAAVYELTEAGRALEPAVHALIRWGGRWLPTGPDSDEFRPVWLALALKALLQPAAAKAPTTRLALEITDAGVWIEIAGGSVASGVGRPRRADLVVSGNPRLVLAVASGRLALKAAEAKGLRCAGAASTRRRFARLAMPVEGQ